MGFCFFVFLPLAFSNSTRENPRKRKTCFFPKQQILKSTNRETSSMNKFQEGINVIIYRLDGCQALVTEKAADLRCFFFFPFRFQFVNWRQAKTFRWLHLSLHKMKTILAISQMEVMRINPSIKHLKVLVIKIITLYKICCIL